MLGCKIYVREVANRATLDGSGGKDSGGTLQEGDILLKINNHTTEGLSLKDARKLIEASKEKLNLVVRREHKPGTSVESTAVPKGKWQLEGNLYVVLTPQMATTEKSKLCVTTS